MRFGEFVNLLALVKVVHRIYGSIKTYVIFAKIDGVLSLLGLQISIPVILMITAKYIDEADFVGWAFFNEKCQLIVFYPSCLVKAQKKEWWN
ncbi:hypothetical protein OKW98_24905 [Pseudomonas sp. KU26590]|uniref:hypothetical protein n=1 Tax=Pseudomonas sp. KU26590 TaxID=2991051 RepID=UPI00223D0369|nr:hypothetical protein [Pseudomonas sp. KU26590]UZJ59741.1 hypothetical protein OKW98_24905 [Pseudomonas sp. KU26590]